MNSDSAIFCFGEENLNSYEENEKRKDGAKIQFCAVFALCAKTAQNYLRKLRYAPSIKHKVLRCAATKTTLVRTTLAPDLTKHTLVQNLDSIACPDMLSRFFDLDSHVPLSGPNLDRIWTKSGANLESGKNRLDQFRQPPTG
jgi:hypothetical protein